MNLQLLHFTPHLAAYYDTHNDWLFVDWQGELTLPVVQAACQELALLCRRRTYARVLNSNAQVTSVSWNVTSWIAHEFMPLLHTVGIEQLAWVCAPSARGQDMVQNVVNHLPQLAITVFDDLELAVSWLQRTRSLYATGQPQAVLEVPVVRAAQVLTPQLTA